MTQEQIDLIVTLGNQVKSKILHWKDATDKYNLDTGENISQEALRCRYRSIHIDGDDDNHALGETYNGDGTISRYDKIWFDKTIKKTPNFILEYFNYDPKAWELVSCRPGKWTVAIKGENANRICETVKLLIKPKDTTQLSSTDYIQLIQEIVNKVVVPHVYNPAPNNNNTYNSNLLMEFPATELHLGKLAWEGETGQNYDYHVAKDRFEKIIQEVINTQDMYKANTLFMTIGNDFFNTDTVDNTTTKGTYQNNDLRYKKLFTVGTKMYISAISTLCTKFKKIDVALCQGNHDTMSSFYLFVALSLYFKDTTNITFSKNYKTTQCYQFGKVAIFTSHGDANFKRLIKSIPAEFYQEWGTSIFRELHVGHLHKELTVDDDSGMITRRLGSPTGTDDWHYNSRYLGATQKQQLFIWDKEEGLLDIKYICFKYNNKEDLQNEK